MKAIVVHEYGGPNVLKFEEYPDSVPGPCEVLVRAAAPSVNLIDCKRRTGLTKDFYSLTFPGPIGIDLAGTMVKIEPSAKGVASTTFASGASTPPGAAGRTPANWESLLH
jgi:NADPH:quinone reductase-like Zn-dependent oxidoreductase